MTVGSMARLQMNMAQAQTKYGSQLDSLYSTYNWTKNSAINKYGFKNNATASKTLDELLNSSALKNKDDNFRAQFSDLYKSIFGIADDSKDEDVASAQSIKAASASAGNAAESIKAFADSMKYGDEVDVDTYKKYAQSFVDSYNAMVDKVGNSDNQAVLQKGVLMVNTGKVYSSTLKRAGITMGADNKLTLSGDLSKVSAVNIKSAFGSLGFSEKVIQKAGQINELTGGNGVFYASGARPSTSVSGSDSDYTDNAGTLKELSAKMKETANNVVSYAKGLGTEDKTYNAEDYTKVAKDFVDSYNKFIDEASKSDKMSVRNRATTLSNGAQAYKYSLQRAGINVDKYGRLSLADETKLNQLTNKDVKYSFGSGGFAQKAIDKADQVNSLVSSASALGYNYNKTTNYAYNLGALFAVYA